MFNAPLSLTTETAFELPSYLHESGAHNPWVVANLHGKDIHSFLEGPCFDAFGNLWVTDIPFGRIFRITPTGEWDLIIKYDGWPNGLKFHPDGRLVIADYRHGLLAMDTDSRRISPLVTHYISQRFQGVNDLTFAKNGDLYFTDQGQSGLHDPSGCVYRLKTDGALQQLRALRVIRKRGAENQSLSRLTFTKTTALARLSRHFMAGKLVEWRSAILNGPEILHPASHVSSSRIRCQHDQAKEGSRSGSDFNKTQRQHG